MKILCIGIDPTTLMFMRAQGVATEAQNDVTDIEDLMSWIAGDEYEALLFNADKRFGIYACREIRKTGIKIPVIAVSEGSEEMHWSDWRSLFLENGGDDLLRQPANPRELHASLRATTRRFDEGLPVDMFDLTVGQARLTINLSTNRVSVNGTYPHLTIKEYQTLAMLAEANGRVVSKEQFLSGLYSGSLNDEPEMKIIDVFICKLRGKLKEVQPDAEGLIETVTGRGYRMNIQHTEAHRVAVANLAVA